MGKSYDSINKKLLDFLRENISKEIGQIKELKEKEKILNKDISEEEKTIEKIGLVKKDNSINDKIKQLKERLNDNKALLLNKKNLIKKYKGSIKNAIKEERAKEESKILISKSLEERLKEIIMIKERDSQIIENQMKAITQKIRNLKLKKEDLRKEADEREKKIDKEALVRKRKREIEIEELKSNFEKYSLEQREKIEYEKKELESDRLRISELIDKREKVLAKMKLDLDKIEERFSKKNQIDLRKIEREIKRLEKEKVINDKEIKANLRDLEKQVKVHDNIRDKLLSENSKKYAKEISALRDKQDKLKGISRRQLGVLETKIKEMAVSRARKINIQISRKRNKTRKLVKKIESQKKSLDKRRSKRTADLEKEKVMVQEDFEKQKEMGRKDVERRYQREDKKLGDEILKLKNSFSIRNKNLVNVKSIAEQNIDEKKKEFLNKKQKLDREISDLERKKSLNGCDLSEAQKEVKDIRSVVELVGGRLKKTQKIEDIMARRINANEKEKIKLKEIIKERQEREQDREKLKEELDQIKFLLEHNLRPRIRVRTKEKIKWRTRIKEKIKYHTKIKYKTRIKEKPVEVIKWRTRVQGKPAKGVEKEAKKLVKKIPEINDKNKMKEFLKQVDELMGKLPEKEIVKFAKSKNFEDYKRIMSKYGIK